jgi:hypothetical protein
MFRIALLATALLSSPAFAIYKCEQNGTVSYSDQPCSHGTALNIDTTPGDSKAAKQQLASDEKKLKQLERERHQQEAQRDREAKQAAREHASRQKTCNNLALRLKWAKEDAASATGKSAEKQKIKARRAEEKYTTECGT